MASLLVFFHCCAYNMQGPRTRNNKISFFFIPNAISAKVKNIFEKNKFVGNWGKLVDVLRKN
jgi:hypothetical protein